jgi:hypothetical protein
MDQWQQDQEHAATPRMVAAMELFGQLEQNDGEYLAMKLTKDEWMENAKQIDDRLGVLGLRIAVRPWRASRD